jgi:hypothetical protein
VIMSQYTELQAWAALAVDLSKVEKGVTRCSG